MKLLVHHLAEDEVYQDIARVPRPYRIDPDGQEIERGIICRLLCKDTENKAFIILYGSRRDGADIGIDNRTRRILGIEPDQSYEFELQRAGFWGRVGWALQSGDVTHRFSSWIALISLFLGFLGLVLGALSVYLSIH